MRQYLQLFLFLFFAVQAYSQTNPTALTIPVSENFGTTDFAGPKPGMASWTGDGARPYTSQALAEASAGGADQAITAGEPVSAGAGGQYGGAPSGNGRLSILQSGNATSGSTQIVMAINTTGLGSATISYDLTMPVVNSRDFGIALQYRVGTTGNFITITGTAVVYSLTSSNGGDPDGPTDYDNYLFALPAGALNQAVVQLRWISWNPSGTGSRSAVGIDNINISSGAITPCSNPAANPTTASGFTTTTSSISFNFPLQAPAPTNYLTVIRTGSQTVLGAVPANGTVYNIGGTLGLGTVVQTSGSNTINATGLLPGTTYTFFTFAYNNAGCTGGPLYQSNLPLVSVSATNALAACTTPAAAPTTLVLTPTSNTITGNFTASSTANRYLVVRSSNATLSAGPVNGTSYTAGAAVGGGTVVQFGTATVFSSVGLNSNTLYYFFVFAANAGCNGEPFYLAASLNGSVTTLNSGVPGNYYAAANGLTCAPLKTALYNIISTGTTVLSYTPGVWNAYQTTDLTRNFANNADIIYDMYSNKGPGISEPYMFTFGTDQCGTYSNEAQCYNREHSTPQSWFNSVSPMVSDIHHLVPTDGYVNGQRGNFPYGTVGTASFTSQNGSKKGNCNYPGYTGTVFEPINEFKGDFARMQLYMAVRYENVIGSWQGNGNADSVLNGSSYQVYDNWYLKLLFDWHTQDPVSAKEIGRNNAVYAIQGNRNPFIDSPQYVYRIWSCTNLLPATVVSPQILNVSNKCFNAASAKGKLSNPPAGATIAVSLDGSSIAYNPADSSFQYFTSNTTSVGNHTVRATYTTTAGSSFKDSVFAVLAVVTPTISVSGVTTVNTGQQTLISSTITNGGTVPTYQWQDSTGASGWQPIAGATNSTINYTPVATGNKLRCVLTSTASCAGPAVVTGNTIIFTVNTVTGVPVVNGNNFGIRLYPNPVAEKIFLSALQITDKWQHMEIIAIDGKTGLLQKNVLGRTNMIVDVQSLAAGVYYLVLKRNFGSNAFIKFVKL